jgi:hypothetical protein
MFPCHPAPYSPLPFLRPCLLAYKSSPAVALALLPLLQHWPFPSEHVMLGYAYILTHPGVPCILWEHYFDWKLNEQIDELVGAAGCLRGGCAAAGRSPCWWQTVWLCVGGLLGKPAGCCTRRHIG